MDMPMVDFLKNQERHPIKIKVMMTPTSCVQDMETPPKDSEVWGRNGGNEKFILPKGVRNINPSMMD